MAFDPSTIKGLAPDEWKALVDYAISELARAQQAEQDAAAGDRETIAGSIGSLGSLLGSPEDPPFDPGGTRPATIYGVRKHDQATLGAHAGLVLDLLLAGLEIVAVNSRAIASVVARGEGGTPR